MPPLSRTPYRQRTQPDGRTRTAGLEQPIGQTPWDPVLSALTQQRTRTQPRIFGFFMLWKMYLLEYFTVECIVNAGSAIDAIP